MKMNREMKSGESTKEERPPIFKSWRGYYRFLLFFLLLQILIYYFLTLRYSI